MDKEDRPQAFGVFKPVGHVVASFPASRDLQQVIDALAEAGIPPEKVARYSGPEMVVQADRDIAAASPLASLGQEMNLVKAHRALAEQGYGFLVVPASDSAREQTVAKVCRRFGAERAQSYGRLVIEELIERPQDEEQVAESPARGLDAQTPSGREKDR